MQQLTSADVWFRIAVVLTWAGGELGSCSGYRHVGGDFVTADPLEPDRSSHLSALGTPITAG
jgi:hypothetical protein